MEKRIEDIRLKAKELRHGFGNPRKITKAKKEELKNSLIAYGDFGSFVIDENYNLIGGSQRAAIIQENWPEQEVSCKMLIGYSESEKKAINIKDNTHSGEWDLDMLADWTADLNIDLGINVKDSGEHSDKPIEQMELIHYEKYDYVIIACRDKISYEQLITALGIKGKTVEIGERNHKTIDARAIWYDDMKAKIVGEAEQNGNS